MANLWIDEGAVPSVEARTAKIHSLLEEVRALVHQERALSRHLLLKIAEVDRRRLYADWGFSSLFEWLIKDLGYSHSAAFRRQQASRLIEASPAAAGKLESGSVNLTTLCQLQTAIHASEVATGIQVDNQTRERLICQIEGRTSHEVQEVLAQEFPGQIPQPELVRPLSNGDVKVTYTMTKEQFEEFQEYRRFISHKKESLRWADSTSFAVQEFMRRRRHSRSERRPRVTMDPQMVAQGAACATEPCDITPNVRNGTKRERKELKRSTKLSKSEIRRRVWIRDQGRCIYKDPQTGNVCGSQFTLQIDHILPRSLGGGDSEENLRCLCRTHNLLMAERILGVRKIEKYRQGKRSKKKRDESRERKI